MTILLIEDNIDFAEKCVEFLFKQKYDVVFSNNVDSAKLNIIEKKFDIALIDLMLPPSFNIEGLNLFRYIKDNHIQVEVIFMTSKEFKTIEIVSEAMKLGAKDFLDKNSINFYSNLLLTIKEIENFRIQLTQPLITKIKNQISNLKDISFQNFITELYSICYENNFDAIKQKRDKGCDGILNKNTIIAVYAPERYEINSFKNKIKNSNPKSLGDFDKYENNWKNKYPNWQFIYNGEITGEMIDFLRALKQDVDFIDIVKIMRLITNLSPSKLKLIIDYLKIPNDYITR